jgi:hypothetical protein
MDRQSAICGGRYRQSLARPVIDFMQSGNTDRRFCYRLPCSILYSFATFALLNIVFRDGDHGLQSIADSLAESGVAGSYGHGHGYGLDPDLDQRLSNARSLFSGQDAVWAGFGSTVIMKMIEFLPFLDREARVAEYVRHRHGYSNGLESINHSGAAGPSFSAEKLPQAII